MKILLLIGACCAFVFTSHSQQTSNIKYGKIAATDLQTKVYAIDSSADAVVLADIGSTAIIGNSKGWFSLEFKHYKRIHILNKNGYYQASIEIPLYSNGEQEEALDNIKAVTYNLENGKVVETKLDKAAIFKEKKSKNLVIKKFTFPNVKEGSIIEYEYKVTSDYLFNLQPWTFQGSAPRLWSEYNLAMPSFLTYIFLAQGYNSFFIKDQKNRTDNFHIREDNGTSKSENYDFTAGVTDYRWVMKDVPELKQENYTSTLENHVSKIEFQLSAYREPLERKDILGTWPELTKNLLERPDFGSSLKGNNNWLGDVVKPIVEGVATDLEKAKKIYAFVRDNIGCTDYSGIYTTQGLKAVLKAKSGNVAEVNLLLTAMLNYAGITADPVILSTSDHGYAYALYPIVDKFNYVITKATIDGVDYTLDASRARLGFGKLTPDCYNGTARLVNAQAVAMAFIADSLKEKKLTSISITNDVNGKWEGHMNQAPGYYESYSIRDKIKEKGQDEFFKEVKKAFGHEMEIQQPQIDSLTTYDQPVALHYDFELKTEGEDILYVNPMFGEGYKENPFKSADRKYPVEMPYTMDETYVLNMAVPKGYEVDELPKQIKVKMNEEGEGYFEYLITQSNGIVSMRSRIKLDRASFMPDEYENLRGFFTLVVNKQNEQIVFKKKK